VQSQAAEGPSALDRAVEEFRVETGRLGIRPDSPKKDRVQRPKWHGRIFENMRNDFFDAVPHQIVQRGGTRSLLRRNQFGFNVAGPVYVPKVYNGTGKTFFSVSYEGMRETIARSALRTVPTAGERVGDFSETVDLSGVALPIYDPLTTRANPSFDASQPVSTENLQYLRDPFPGNRIPQERLDPVAMQTVALYPEANANAGPFFRNNYFIVSPESNTANGFIFKVDHNFDQRHRTAFHSAWSNGSARAAAVLPGPLDSSSVDNDFSSRSAAVEHVFSMSPQTVNTTSVSAATYTSQNVSGVYPLYRFGGNYVPTGKYNPEGRYTQNDFDFSDGVSMKRGKHSLRFSGSLSLQQAHALYDWFPQGAYNFGAGMTSLPGIVNTGHSFASFLLGQAEYAEVTKMLSPSYFRRTRTNLAVSDQYNVTPTLSVSAGVNVEISTPRVEKYDRQSTVDFGELNPANGKPGALVFAGEGGQERGFRSAIAAWEPTVGLAWSIGSTSQTVMRVELAQRYQSMPIGYGQFGTQGFNASPAFVSANAQLVPAVVLENGLPDAGPVPDLRADAVNGMYADYLDQTSRLPRTRSASLTLERQLPSSMTMTLGLGHTEGENMFTGNWGADLNAIPLAALEYRDRLNNEEFRSSLRPYPQYVGFDLNGLYPGGDYQRDGGYVKLEKRTSRGLSLSATYEFAKQLDDYSSGVQDFFRPEEAWARTPGVAPHRFSMTYVYELPFGPGKPLLTQADWRRYITEGWSLSGMSVVNSGDPLIIRPQFNNTGGVVKYLYPNVVPGVDPSVANPSADLWFNPTAFAQPADFTTGNLSRTHPYLLLPGSQNHDLSVTKRFTIGAESSVELSAVGFNFINHANWTDPDTVIGPVDAPNVNAGKIIGSAGGRVIQLGLRYSF
jgi:hypothetical protein